MDNLNEIFSRATQSDLDTELAAAGELLQKVAEDQGIDLTQLSDDDVAELMVDLMPSKLAAEEPEKGETKEHEKKETKAEEKKEDKGEDKKASIPEGLTFADVAVELSKAAAAEGVDLSQLSREDYHAAFDAIATRMASPEFAVEKQAAEEAQAKIAEADALGRVMARAFMDEQAKVAASPLRALPEGARQAIGKAVGAVKRQGAAAVEGAKGLPKQISEGAAGAKKKLEMGIAKRLEGPAKERLERSKSMVSTGAKAVGATALGGAGFAAGRASKDDGGKRKKSAAEIEAAALELARNFLAENGIDPDTGKQASDPDVEARALEILKEAGYSVE
jgi:hypothetical protein